MGLAVVVSIAVVNPAHQGRIPQEVSGRGVVEHPSVASANAGGEKLLPELLQRNSVEIPLGYSRPVLQDLGARQDDFIAMPSRLTVSEHAADLVMSRWEVGAVRIDRPLPRPGLLIRPQHANGPFDDSDGAEWREAVNPITLLRMGFLAEAHLPRQVHGECGGVVSMEQNLEFISKRIV